jgi:DNA-3-methyladenine glycosylase I
MASSSMGVEAGPDGRARCWWCLEAPEYIDYHDRVWGRPIHDERELFEMLVLESFQSGLSWLTILRKREVFRRAFDGWDIAKVAAYGDRDVDRLLADHGIVRHRGKIDAAITNAAATRALHERGETLAALLWSFAPAPDGASPPARRSRPRRDHAGIQGDGEGAKGARLSLHRSDHRLLDHAGRRAGQRPSRRLRVPLEEAPRGPNAIHCADANRCPRHLDASASTPRLPSTEHLFLQVPTYPRWPPWRAAACQLGHGTSASPLSTWMGSTPPRSSTPCIVGGHR